MTQNSHKAYELLLKNVGTIIHGKDESIKLVLTAWFAGGHILIEDNPGTGKTMLAKSVAKSVNIEFGRVQFTPDLLPSDITGSMIYDETSKEFQFNRGPVFSSILLADEINRATPRTQSALLEAMGEFQVTVDRSTHKLDSEFFVIATQNPIEQHGTFPLPEAQLDRFSMKIGMGYPGRESELQMLMGRLNDDPFSKLAAVVRKEHIQEIKKVVAGIKLTEATMKYILDVVEKTRSHPEISLPASPRASISLMKIGQAYSFISGDDFVRPGTIYKLLPYVLEHRIAQTNESRFQGRKKSEILAEILDKVRVPTK
ncbi:MAG: MoxR family ATPase [Bdellovibrionales bacterium]|nr:MoxR family ATPase [Bdellovibrionales bacterium]